MLRSEEGEQYAALSAYEPACHIFRNDCAAPGQDATLGKLSITVWQPQDDWHLEMPRVALSGCLWLEMPESRDVK